MPRSSDAATPPLRHRTTSRQPITKPIVAAVTTYEHSSEYAQHDKVFPATSFHLDHHTAAVAVELGDVHALDFRDQCQTR